MEHYILEVAHTQANLAAISIAKESIKQATMQANDDNKKSSSAVLDRKGIDGKLTGPGPAMTKKKKKSNGQRRSGSNESYSQPEDGTLQSMESAAQMSNYK